ncbi:hypothetical protein BDB01DRAFT_847340 [Pilobolus umbonatus]|nr:hypothetical protein BDB01DRAFT_847340 [Pilobolus umbonatus]
MENPNIHNIPYARSRDQKRWRGHSKKISSRAETTERMRKWRAENRDKNKRNDLRCRVYRLARQKFGEEESMEKQQFIDDEINRRLGRRMLLEKKSMSTDTEIDHMREDIYKSNSNDSNHTVTIKNEPDTIYSPVPALTELPFYSAPLHKIELPSIDIVRRPSHINTTEPSIYCSRSQPCSPKSDLSGCPWQMMDRRLSNCSSCHSSSNSPISTYSLVKDAMLADNHSMKDGGNIIMLPHSYDSVILPPMHSLLAPADMKPLLGP